MGTTTKRRGRYVPDEELTKFELFLRQTIVESSRCMEKLAPYAVLVFITVHCTYSLLYIRSRVVSDCSTLRSLIEGLLSVYVLINIIGNFLMNLVTDNSLKKRAPQSCEESNYRGLTYCDKCKVYQTDGSCHCKKCDVCVVERDYHCFLFNKCVGRYTKRYYVTGLLYALIGMLYQTCYVFAYPCKEDGGISNPILEQIASAIMASTWYFSRLYKTYCLEKVFFVMLNFSTIALVMYLLGIQVSSVIRGAFLWEVKTAKKKNFTLVKKDIWSRTIRTEIMEDIFGYRWYWTILWPFVSSPLPEPKKQLM